MLDMIRNDKNTEFRINGRRNLYPEDSLPAEFESVFFGKTLRGQEYVHIGNKVSNGIYQSELVLCNIIMATDGNEGELHRCFRVLFQAVYNKAFFGEAQYQPELFNDGAISSELFCVQSIVMGKESGYSNIRDVAVALKFIKVPVPVEQKPQSGFLNKHGKTIVAVVVVGTAGYGLWKALND